MSQQYLFPRELAEVTSLRLLPDDVWELTVVTATTSFVVTYRGLVATDDGVVVPFEFAASRGTLALTAVQLFGCVSGQLVSVLATVAGTGVDAGDVFTRLALRRGSSASAAISVVLVQGYPESQSVLQWPGPNSIGPMTNYELSPTEAQFANPVAGNNAVLIFGRGYPLRLESCGFVLTTDANVATRRVSVSATGAFGNLWTVFAQSSQTAGLVVTYLCGIHGFNPTLITGTIPIPIPESYNPPGSTIAVAVDSIQVGDQLSAIRACARTVFDV